MRLMCAQLMNPAVLSTCTYHYSKELELVEHIPCVQQVVKKNIQNGCSIQRLVAKLKNRVRSIN